MRRGIDVSHWQGAIDWPAVGGDDIAFAMCKATQSTGMVDKRWAKNREGARKAGIPVGAYHFATPDASNDDAVAEARHHLRHATPAPGDLVPALDLEGTKLDAKGTTRWALRWLATVEEAIGATPIVYTGPGFASTHVHPDPALKRYPLWVAHYTSAARPRLPKPWTDWMWWQHTDSGPVAGIAGGVDTNRMATSAFPLWRPGVTPPSEEDDMPLSDDDKDWIKKAIDDSVNRAVGAVWTDEASDKAEAGTARTNYGSLRGWVGAIAEKVGATRERAMELDPTRKD